MARLAVGIDVGGTSIKSGLIDESGRVLYRSRLQTPPRSSSAQAIVDTIIESGIKARAAAERVGVAIGGVGLGLPEYSLGPDWIQRQCSNIPALEGVALYPPLRSAFGPSIVCDLDTQAATLAELRFGAGTGYERLIFMGVGTGISCGIVVDGQLLRHTFGTSGDTGHLIVDPAGTKPCTCGGRGCLETFTSARAIREAGLEAAASGSSAALATVYQERGDLGADDITEAARRGDPTARGILERAGHALGVALTSLMHIYLPHAILVGGGVSGAGDLLLEPARQAIRQLAAAFYAEQLRELRVAAFGPEAGMIGAAALVFQAAKQT
jgi:glucokinase